MEANIDFILQSGHNKTKLDVVERKRSSHGCHTPMIWLQKVREKAMKILIAEDEPDMQRILRLYLLKAGYEVSVASDGQEAFDKLCAEPFDLLVTDWMMPKMDGIALCKEIRAYDLAPVKIIMLTAKDETQHEIHGLSCGADDYIRKPFDPNILLLRIKKLLQLEDVLCCGNLVLHLKSKSLFIDRKEVKLTQKEFKLLEMLLLNKGITVSREQLLNRVWGNDYEGDDRTLDTHIRRLRGKLGKEYISTFVGIGYRMEAPNE